MEKQEYHVEGTKVVYSDRKPLPYNPLNRPPVNFKKFIFAVVCFIILNTVTCFVANLVFDTILDNKCCITKTKFIVLTAIGVSLLFILLLSKKACIWMIHLYQHYASDETRLSCVFEPSCSEYMIMCINKFGVFRGILKGIKRLSRCHPPNGGKDYP